MKKIVVFLICLLFFQPFPSFAESPRINVVIDGIPLSFPDVQPLIKDGRILVPVRGIFEGIGATVSWDGEKQEILSFVEDSKNKTTVELKINSTFVKKEVTRLKEQKNSIVQVDVSPTIYKGRTLVPLRISGEAFGYNVEWNEETKTAYFNKKKTFQTSNGSFKEYGFIPSTTYSPSQKELEVFFFTNHQREKRGKKPLTLNVELSYVAAVKSDDMFTDSYFSHTSPTYGSPFDLMEAFNITFKMAGENIAAGYESSESVMDAWMDSPGHRANILKDDYTEIGIGVVEEHGQYNTYWTQLFRTPF